MGKHLTKEEFTLARTLLDNGLNIKQVSGIIKRSPVVVQIVKESKDLNNYKANARAHNQRVKARADAHRLQATLPIENGKDEQPKEDVNTDVETPAKPAAKPSIEQQYARLTLEAVNKLVEVMQVQADNLQLLADKIIFVTNHMVIDDSRHMNQQFKPGNDDEHEVATKPKRTFWR